MATDRKLKLEYIKTQRSLETLVVFEKYLKHLNKEHQ